MFVRSRHASWANTPVSRWRPRCRLVHSYTYCAVAPSSLASADVLDTRPVNSAYRLAAAACCPAEAPGRLAAPNKGAAGSLVRMPMLTVGNSDEFLAQMSYCVNDPPRLMLCDPFSEVSVSSTSMLLALRDSGIAPALGLVSPQPTDGKLSWNPACFPPHPPYI